MSAAVILLPVLDGTLERTCARLDAWVRAAEGYAIEDALYGATETLADVVRTATALASSCPDRTCTAEADTVTVRDELGELGTALLEIDAAAAELQRQAMGDVA